MDLIHINMKFGSFALNLCEPLDRDCTLEMERKLRRDFIQGVKLLNLSPSALPVDVDDLHKSQAVEECVRMLVGCSPNRPWPCRFRVNKA